MSYSKEFKIAFLVKGFVEVVIQEDFYFHLILSQTSPGFYVSAV